MEEESGAGTSGASAGASDTDADDKDSKDKKKKNRCAVCRKKVGLTGKHWMLILFGLLEMYCVDKYQVDMKLIIFHNSYLLLHIHISDNCDR